MSKSYIRARVKVCRGQKKMNQMYRQAGLGLTGVGVEDFWLIEYAPGEVVTMDRARAGMAQLMEAVNSDAEMSMEIMSFSVVALEKCFPDGYAYEIDEGPEEEA